MATKRTNNRTVIHKRSKDNSEVMSIRGSTKCITKKIMTILITVTITPDIIGFTKLLPMI